LNEESRIARVYGGMHFGFSTVAGVELGSQVARWVGRHHFARRD
jgi:membrane-associated phospholipid phosphatase